MLAQLKIAPTPARYTVAYIHLTGGNADLSAAVDRLAARDKLSGETMDEIYFQFFGNHVEEAELHIASQKFGRTVTEVIDVIDVASDRAAHFGSVLEGFSDQAEGASKGDLNKAVTSVIAETRSMADLNRDLESRLQASAQEIGALREHLEQIEREASLDALTGVGNRKRFDAALRDAILTANRESLPLCLLMVDIDHFKTFNDNHGHQMGDQVLRLVARSMSDCVKGQDTIARYGGEEFGIILPRTRLEDGIRLGDQIRRHVASKKIVNRRTGTELGQITMSLGAAQLRGDDGPASLVQRADDALYFAKRNGRNRVASETDIESAG